MARGPGARILGGCHPAGSVEGRRGHCCVRSSRRGCAGPSGAAAIPTLLPPTPFSPIPLPATASPETRPTEPAPTRPAPGRWIRHEATPGARAYDVYLPAGHRRRARAPMLLLLHGCRQAPAEFVDASRFTAVADRNRVVLVLPRQESRHHPQRCWRWYEAAHQQRGSGEPAMLAAVVASVVAERERWRIDPRRVYVAGLSAGGAMALVLGACYPDLFAAVGVHSAPPYRAATRAGQALAAMAARTAVPSPRDEAGTPLIVVQGTADRVVHPNNGDRVADQWLATWRAAHALPTDGARVTRRRVDAGRSGDGREYTRVRWYTARGHRVLEHWTVTGLGHAWSGGRPGGSFSDPAGPRAATVMWDFFRGQRLERAGAVPLRAAGA